MNEDSRYVYYGAEGEMGAGVGVRKGVNDGDTGHEENGLQQGR